MEALFLRAVISELLAEMVRPIPVDSNTRAWRGPSELLFPEAFEDVRDGDIYQGLFDWGESEGLISPEDRRAIVTTLDHWSSTRHPVRVLALLALKNLERRYNKSREGSTARTPPT